CRPFRAREANAFQPGAHAPGYIVPPPSGALLRSDYTSGTPSGVRFVGTAIRGSPLRSDPGSASGNPPGRLPPPRARRLATMVSTRPPSGPREMAATGRARVKPPPPPPTPAFVPGSTVASAASGRDPRREGPLLTPPPKPAPPEASTSLAVTTVYSPARTGGL